MDIEEPVVEASNKETNGKTMVKSDECIVLIGHLNEDNKAREFIIKKTDTAGKLFTTYCTYLVGDELSANGENTENLKFEHDYFGLKYCDSHRRFHWLDLDKSLYKQITSAQKLNKTDKKNNNSKPTSLRISFRMKHYPPNLDEMKYEFTRYLCYVQIRRDLIQGRLLCPSPDDWAKVAALIYQIEEGDSQLTSMDNHLMNRTDRESTLHEIYQKRMFLEMPANLTQAIAIAHLGLKGTSRQDAADQLLRLVIKFPTYGIDPYQVKPFFSVTESTSSPLAEDHDFAVNNTSIESANGSLEHKRSQTTANGTAQLQKQANGRNEPHYYLGIGHFGMQLFVGTKLIKLYEWTKISRMTYKSRIFKILYSSDENGLQKKEKYAFQLSDASAALSMWRWANDRKCFFTLDADEKAKKIKSTTSILKRSKSFKFTGNSLADLKKDSQNSMAILDSERIRPLFKSMRVVGDISGKIESALVLDSKTMKSSRSPRPPLMDLVQSENLPPQQQEMQAIASSLTSNSIDRAAENDKSYTADNAGTQSNRSDSLIEEESPIEKKEIAKVNRMVSEHDEALRKLDRAIVAGETRMPNGNLNQATRKLTNGGPCTAKTPACTRSDWERFGKPLTSIFITFLLVITIALAVYVLESRNSTSSKPRKNWLAQLGKSQVVDSFARNFYDPVRNLVVEQLFTLSAAAKTSQTDNFKKN